MAADREIACFSCSADFESANEAGNMPALHAVAGIFFHWRCKGNSLQRLSPRRHQEKLDQLRAFVSWWLNRISASNNLLLPPGLAVARQNLPFRMQEIIGRLLAGDAAREPVKWVQKAACRITRSSGRSAMFIEKFCSTILKLQRSDMLANCF